MSNNRKDDVKKYLEWYKKKEGREFIEKYINIGFFVKENYTYSGGQKESNSGVYAIFFNGICVYIGESGQLGFRMLEHFKHMVTDGINKFGIDPLEIESGRVKVSVAFLEKDILNETDRKRLESLYISLLKPILQTSLDLNDKAKAIKDSVGNTIWLDKKSISSDWCIKESLRKERIDKYLK